MTNTNMK